MTHPWLTFGSPVRRPSYATQGWAQDRPARSDIHRGMDIRAAVGDPVYAIGDGVVQYARANYAGSDAGNWIGVLHEGDLLSRYLHLSKIFVAAGQQVRRGDLIGAAGMTGASSPHLHFDVYLPESRLAEYVQLFGTPASGFRKSDFGYKVPGEPLIPIDAYAQKVIDGARSQGILFYGQVKHSSSGTIIAVVGILALAGAGVYYVKTVQPRWFR